MKNNVKSWKERIFAIGKKDHKATALLEVDDSASGEKLVFPEIGDISELAEGVTVTATDGTHVITVDGKTYTFEVSGGVVSSLEVTEQVVEEADAFEAMSEETVALVQEIATELNTTAEFRTKAEARISELEATIKSMKALIGHAQDDDKKDPVAEGRKIKIGDREIDLSKCNLK